MNLRLEVAMLKRILLAMLIVVAAAIGLTLLWKSNIWLFIDLNSILLVPFLGSLFALCLHGFGEGLAAFSIPFDGEASEGELRTADAFFKLLGQSYLWFAFLGGILSFIDALRNLADKTMLGPRLALCCVSLEYAALLTLLIVVPYRASIRRRLAAGS